jgi:branched-chain amino acid aminotransferase
MVEPAIWIDGRREPVDAPHVSARDRGLTLADGLFETMRVRAGVAFRLERHLARLSEGLARLEIPLPHGLRAQVLEAAAAAGGDDAALRVTVTRGRGPGGLAPPREAIPTVIVATGPLPSLAADVNERGLAAVTASGRRNPRAMTAGLKSLSYTDAIAALLEARRAGADEAILLDTDDHCSEATASNLFVLARGALLTPPLSCAALPGITREAVLDIAGRLGVAAVERPFGPAELLNADEAFLTSSLRGIAPLVSIDARSIGLGRPGELTRIVRAEYDRLLDGECRA